MPVSPGCNIGCRFCEQTINDVEERPGVTSKVIIQKQAVVVDMVVIVAVDVEHRMDCHKK